MPQRSLVWEHSLGGPVGGVAKPAFRGGEVTPYNRSWQPEHRSGEAAHLENWDTLQGRARWIGRNDGFIKKMLGKAARRISRVNVRADVRRGGEDAVEFNAATDQLFDDWRNSQECDAEGKSDWDQLSYLIVRELFVAGEVFVVRVDDPHEGRLVPLSLQLLETEQLDSTVDRPRSGDKNRIVRGIELDEANREVAYYFCRPHPYGVDGAPPKTQRVDASRALHMFLRVQPSETHGSTHLATIVQSTKDRDFLVGSELVSAGFQSLMSFGVFRDTGVGNGTGLDDGTGSSVDAHGNETFRLGRANVVNMTTRDKIEMFETNRPGPQFEPFAKFLLLLESAGFELSFANALGDYSMVNFHGAKMGAADDAEVYEFFSKIFVSSVLRPVYAWFVEQAVGLGLYDQVFDDNGQPAVTADEFVRARRQFLRVMIIFPRRLVLDERGQNLADLMAIDGGLKLRSEALAERGHRYRDFIGRRRREIDDERDLNFRTPGQADAQAGLDAQRAADDFGKEQV